MSRNQLLDNLEHLKIALPSARYFDKTAYYIRDLIRLVELWG